MKLAVLGDTHDRHDNVAEALRLLRGFDPEVILHCGDITSAETVGLFEGDPVRFVFGNCDADHRSLGAAIRDIGCEVFDPFGTLELGGRKIAWTHGHHGQVLKGLVQSGEYDFVFHGHTHLAEERVVGPTRVINPGALQRAHPKTCGVLDLDTGEWTSIRVAS